MGEQVMRRILSGARPLSTAPRDISIGCALKWYVGFNTQQRSDLLRIALVVVDSDQQLTSSGQAATTYHTQSAKRLAVPGGLPSANPIGADLVVLKIGTGEPRLSTASGGVVKPPLAQSATEARR